MAKVFKKGQKVPYEDVIMFLSQVERFIVRTFELEEYSCFDLIFGAEWYEFSYKGDSVAKQKEYIKNLKKLNDFKVGLAELSLVFSFPMLINKHDYWYFEGDTETGDIMDSIMESIRNKYEVTEVMESVYA